MQTLASIFYGLCMGVAVLVLGTITMMWIGWSFGRGFVEAWAEYQKDIERKTT